MVSQRRIVRVILLLLIAIPFAGLLVYFLQIEFGLNLNTAATVVAVIVAILFGILDVAWQSTDSESPEQKSAQELINDIFGPDTSVIQIEDTEEFAEKIQSAANSAVDSVDRIHFNMHYVNRVEDNFTDPTVNHRILLAKPVSANDPHASSQTGELSGLDSVYESNIDTNPPIDQFIQRFDYIHTSQEEDRWNNVDVRLYETTPWLRAAIIDSNKAGFLLLPSMYDGAKAAKFWTEDPNVVDTLESIYDDVWHDPRTEWFHEWYEDRSKLE